MAQKPGVLITRPEDQLDELSELVAQAGARPVPFPLLRIEPVAEAGPDRAADPSAYRLIVFVSRNAAVLGVPRLQGAPGGFPGAAIVLAVGAATARELAVLGVSARNPQRSDTEGLLAMDETQRVAGARVLIVRGVGGRELLAETLRERGALVDYLEVYRRGPYPWTPAELAGVLQDARVELVTITSAESLEHFDRLLRDSGVAPPALLLSSQRLGARARELGYTEIHVAEGAESVRMAAAVAAWLRVA